MPLGGRQTKRRDSKQRRQIFRSRINFGYTRIFPISRQAFFSRAHKNRRGDPWLNVCPAQVCNAALSGRAGQCHRDTPLCGGKWVHLFRCGFDFARPCQREAQLWFKLPRASKLAIPIFPRWPLDMRVTGGSSTALFRPEIFAHPGLAIPTRKKPPIKNRETPPAPKVHIGNQRKRQTIAAGPKQYLRTRNNQCGTAI